VSRLKNWLSKDDKTLRSAEEKSHRPMAVADAKSGLKSAGVIETETNFYRYLVSKALLLPQSEEIDSEISDNRILLDIELAPALARQASKQESKDLFNALKVQLFHDVETRVEKRLMANDDNTYQRFTIAPYLMEAMNIINTKAASVSRIKPLVLKHATLVQNMVNVLNRFDAVKKSSDKPLEKKDAELCLGYLGIETLRVLLPYLIVHESLKDTGIKFHQISRKLWNHVQITAKAASVLATLDDRLDPDEVYMMALFHEMGAAFLLHVVDECFHETRRELSKQAMESGASEVSHKLAEINSAIPVLDKLMPEKAKALSVDIARRYKMNHFRLASTMEELAQSMSIDDMGVTARVIAQARSYAVFKQMYKEELIDKIQATALLNYYQIDSAKIKLLNQQKYLKVPKVEP
jgi:hypothetical protein